MTVVAGYLVPGGAVLACDSRVLAGDQIASDSCDKFVIAGSAVCLVSGQDGALMEAIGQAKNFEGVRMLATEYQQGNSGLNWNLLCYDRRTEQLLDFDSDGCTLTVGPWATRGAGGPYAAGALSASSVPRTLEAAEKLVRKACSIAIKHSAACGGRIRVLTVRGKRTAVEVR